ncbi:MAG: dihydroorotate dehydrogenase electron transfer subunit [Eubacteriales bacterium]|nr:dihydroorotate dehydrogenase electron transfer subunit [Eubacteriales bacterium]
MEKSIQARVVSNRAIARGIYEMELECGQALDVTPGQFLHIAVPGDGSRILRRPISICRAQGSGITLLYQVVGEGTHRFSCAVSGDMLDCLGPLGNGFSVGAQVKRAAALGGGIGTAPLYQLMAANPQVEFDLFAGSRSGDLLYYMEEFAQVAHTHWYTDDGSAGEKGFAAQGLAQALQAGGYDAVYACGPMPMVRALAQVMKAHPQTPCQVSLEERMGCGVGACLVCTCKIKQGDAWHHKRVCADGPVFPISEVMLDE